MQILTLDDVSISELHRVRTYAEMNPFTMDDLLDMYNGEIPVPGLRKECTCYVPIDILIVFSLQYNHEDRLLRRLSVSAGGKKIPPPIMVEKIMKQLGFERTLKEIDRLIVGENAPIPNVIIGEFVA